jgi:hypothetical protein
MTTNEVSVVIVCSATDTVDDEQRQELAQLLAEELRQLDGVQSAGLVSEKVLPPGGKAVAGFVIGAVEALISAGALNLLVDYLKERLLPTPIEITISQGNRKVSTKIRSRADFERVMALVDEGTQPHT